MCRARLVRIMTNIMPSAAKTRSEPAKTPAMSTPAATVMFWTARKAVRTTVLTKNANAIPATVILIPMNRRRRTVM